MNRRTSIIAAFAIVSTAATPLFAHDDFRVVGVITKVGASKLDVKSKEGRNISIKMNKETLITRDKNKVGASELKSGQSVVVDATGDTEADLLALEVRIVPAIAPAKGK
jgi:hypothetical protein